MRPSHSLFLSKPPTIHHTLSTPSPLRDLRGDKIILDNTSTLCYICCNNKGDSPMIIFANVGKRGNLAQSLLSYIQKNRFYRKFASRFHHNSRNPKAIRETRLSGNSVNFCKFAEFLQNPHPKPKANPMNNLNNSTKQEREMDQQKTLLFQTVTAQRSSGDLSTDTGADLD